MSQVSEIIVTWTPVTSGRAREIQIQSRIVGTDQWTPQGERVDPALGELRFQSNAPSTHVEVRCRIVSTDNIPGDWFSADLTTAPAVVEYDTVSGAPKNLGELDSPAKVRLDDAYQTAGDAKGAAQIADGKAVVADGKAQSALNNQKDSGGNIVTVASLLNTINTGDAKALSDAKSQLAGDISAAKAEGTTARQEAAKVRTDLVPTITKAQGDATQARTDVGTTRTDLSNEVSRAKGAEGTLQTKVETAQGRADQAYTAVGTETTQRTDADSALGQRIDTVTSTANTDRADYQSKIQQEATTRANAVSAVADRATTLETRASQIPESFGVVARGYNAGVPSGRTAGVYNAAGQLVAGAGGYLLVIFNKNSNVIGYADNFNLLASADEAARMAAVLNGLEVGRTVVVTTIDEPRANRLSNGLQAALEKCGAGALFSSDKFAYRGAYVLIGRSGIGKGSGQEYYAGSSDSATDAWLEVPFQIINGLAPLNGAGAAVLETNAKLSEEQTARANADSAIVGRTEALEASVNNSTNSLSNLRAGINSEVTARTDADKALAGRAEALEATVNTGPNRNASLRAGINDEVIARTDADSALSLRTQSLESTVNTGANRNALLRSDLTTEASTRSTADSTLASRATTLESTVGDNGVVNANPNFQSYPATTGSPPGWTGDNQVGSNATRVAGEKGGYAVQLVGPANGQSYAGQNLQRIEAQTYCVIEADIKLVSGTLAGAGILFRAGSDIHLNFTLDKDSTDTVVGNGTAGRIYRFRKFVQTTGAAATPVLYYMSHWSGFNSGIAAANSIIWYRCAVRPASASEITAQKADTALNTPSTGVIARLTTEESTRANADSALAGRAEALEATVNIGPNRNAQLRASINDEVTARTDADKALATRASSLETRSSQIPESFTVVARGGGAGVPSGRAAGVYGAAGQSIAGAGRSYLLVIFNKGTNTVGYADNFDVYGSTNEATRMASVLNNLEVGRTVVIATVDEPRNNRLTNGLQAALERCGAGALFSSANFSYRGAYALVGRSGIGKGNGQEFYAGSSAADAGNGPTDAWLEVPFNVLGGLARINGAGAAVIETNAKLSEEATARSNADSALVGRTSTLETNYSTVRRDLNQWNQDRYDDNTRLAGRLTNEETARSNADSALVRRASTLEATAGTQAGVIVPNSTFSIWDDGLETPNYWGWWQKSGTIERVATGRSTGGYAAKITSPANANSGISQQFGGGPTINQGWYVLEADVQLVSGTWKGSGLSIQGIYSINFAIEADASGAIDATYIGLRRFTKLLKVNEPGYTNWHPMDNWDGFNLPRDAKTLIWYRAALRPATDGEIIAQKVDAALNTPVTGVIARLTAEETARATAISAIASRTSSVEASVSQGGFLHPNSMFTREPRLGFGAPYAWGQWAREGDGYYGSWGSNGNNYGGYAIQIDRAGMNAGLQNFVTGTFPKGWYVLECEVRLEDGASAGAGFHANFNNDSYGQIDFNRDPDTYGYVGAHGTGNYKFTKMIFNATESGAIYLYMMAGWSGFNLGYNGFLRTIWFKAGIRPATTSEVQAGKVQGIDARVTTTETAVANINGKTQAYFEKRAAVSGAEAFAVLSATNDQGQATSNVSLGASSINLYNVQDNSAKLALSLKGGSAVFSGNLTAQTGITVGTGIIQVALRATDYQVSDGQVVNFGLDLGRPPSVSFDTMGAATLSSGENYNFYADGLTSTGFTARLRIVSAPVTSNQSIGAMSQSGSGPQWQGSKSGKPDASYGTYTFSISGYINATAYGTNANDYR